MLRFGKTVLKHRSKTPFARELFNARHVDSICDVWLKRRIDGKKLNDCNSASVAGALAVAAAGAPVKGPRQVVAKLAAHQVQIARPGWCDFL